MSTINNRIKELREEKLMTKAAFAALIGVNQQRVYEIESNKVAPSEKAIMGIIENLGVNMDWLMRGMGEKYAKADKVKEPESSYGAGILENMAKNESDMKSKIDFLIEQVMKLNSTVQQLEKKLEAA